MDDPRPDRLLGWWSGGWVLAAAGALAVLAAVWTIRSAGAPRATRGTSFDLTAARVPAERITPTGLGPDGIPSLDLPQVMRGADVATFNEEHRGKYLVSEDRVIGVRIDGTARAYPLRVLNWHEVVNDVVSGVPIAVTYHPLCDSIVVFDRRSAGRTLELGTSGLLFESNLLLYDRRADGVPSSLWSQLLAAAVAGPAAERGATLDVLPVSVLRWREWLALHPDTTVLRPDDQLLERYERDPYGNYYLTRKPRYPVAAYPPPGPLAPWTRVLVPLPAADGAESTVLPLEGEAAGAAGLAGVEIVAGAEPPASVVAGPEARAGTVYARWWAWHAVRARAPSPASDAATLRRTARPDSFRP